MKRYKGLFLKVALIVISILLFLTSSGIAIASSMEGSPEGSSTPWWIWPLGLFVFTFVLGIVAVLGGVGGGVLYVPIVSGFFPFHLDFVRAAGLLVALSTALSAGPGLLKRNLASLRLAMPMALIASTASIFGALIGLALPTNVVQILLGATIIYDSFYYVICQKV